MILVTRLDRQVMLLNPDHIISIEETPDTVITLYNGHHILVREHSTVLVSRIIAFRSKLLKRAGTLCQRPKYLTRSRQNLYTPPAIELQKQQGATTGLPPFHHQDT